MPLSDDLSLLPDNSNQEITPADVRTAFTSIHTSLDDDEDFAGTMATALAAKVAASLYDANTILKADTDNTPEALTVAEQRLVGRITGGEITALTAAQTLTMLGTAAIPDSAFTVSTPDLTAFNFDTNPAIDLGTAGYCRLEWCRLGRAVAGVVKIKFDTDWTDPGGFYIVGIAGTNLPVAAKDPTVSGVSFGSPGGYGFIYRTESAEAAADGFLHGMSPTIANLGSPSMIFTKTADQTGVGSGLLSMWYGENASGSPTAEDWGGSLYQGMFFYEANAAA